MWKIFFLIFLFSLPSISYGNIFTSIDLWDINLEYITYPVGSNIYNIKVWVSQEAVNLSDLSTHYNAISGINWVFFCPEDYRSCNGENYTINERFVDGEDLSFYQDTGDRGVFWWDSNTVPFLHRTKGINEDNRQQIFEWLGNFPIIYANGTNLLEYYHDVWLYDSKMRASLPRHFICSNKEKTEIFFGRSSPSSLDTLAPALFKIWCWDALNLDAWKSSHFNYNGREIISGSRKIIDGIFIQRQDFNTQKTQKNIATAISKISQTYKKYPKEVALSRLQAVTNYIPKLRQDIYNAYATQTLDNLWNTNWYILEVDTLSDFKKVYTFNILEKELKNLIREIRN